MVNAKTIMSPNVITVTPEEDIYEAIRIMVLNNVTGLPVVEADDTLVGIITEKDVLGLLYDGEDESGTVRQYMTAEVVTFSPEDDLKAVVETFISHAFRRVPILDEGKLIGVISRKDVVRHISNVKGQDALLAKDSILELLY